MTKQLFGGGPICSLDEVGAQTIGKEIAIELLRRNSGHDKIFKTLAGNIRLEPRLRDEIGTSNTISIGPSTPN